MIVFITAVNISAIDLNLFLVLHTVLEERSATRAARRLHVTQSAVSNALSRLRGLLGDPLLVRSGRGLVPTPLALELAPRIAAAVKELEGVLQRDRRFDPASTTRAFTLACTDNQELSDLPQLIELFHRRLPLATLHVMSMEQLVEDDSTVDVLLAPDNAVGVSGEYLHRDPLYVEEGAVVLRRDHPLAGRRITREQFQALPHIDVRFLGKSSFGHVAPRQKLAQLEPRRRIALTVPHFMAAAIAATRTDYLASLPSRFAVAACGLLPLRIAEPAASQRFQFAVSLFWHERTHSDEGARFFRKLIAEALRDPSSRATSLPLPPRRPPSRASRRLASGTAPGYGS